MNAIMNKKGRQTKLLAAIAVLAMVVCAFAAVVDAADPVSYGEEATPMNQAEFNKLIEDGVITISKPTTWNLTGNIVSDNVTIVLKNNLMIQNTGENNYKFSIAYNGDAAPKGSTAEAAITTSGATSAVNLYINNVDAVFDNTTTNASWTINSVTNGLTVTVEDSNVQINKTADYVEGHGAIWQTATGTTKLNVIDSTVGFKSNGQGVQAMLVTATNSNINVDVADGTFSVYADLDNSRITGDNVAFYGAVLKNNSSVSVTNLGMYSGSSNAAFTVTGLSVATVSMDAGSSVNATTIMNDLSEAATTNGSGTKTATFTGGSVSGELKQVDAVSGENKTFTLSSTNTTNVTIADGTTVATSEITGDVVAEVPATSTDVEKDIKDKFDAGATIVSVPSGTIDASITGISGQLALGDDVEFATDNQGQPTVTLTLTTTGSISKDFNGESVIIASSDNSSSVKLLNASGNITFFDGSVVIDGKEGIDDTTVEITGNVKIYGEVNGQLKLVNKTGTLTIMDEKNEYSTLTVSEGAELILEGFENWNNSAGGILDVQGTLTSTNASAMPLNFTANAKIITYPTTNLNNVTLDGNVEYKTSNIAYEFKGMLDQNFTVSTEQSLTGDLWIPDGVTLTIASGGVLNMAGYGIYVQGTLDVQANGAIKNLLGANTDSVFKGQILLHRDGEIVNEGVIGSGSKVTVSADINQKSENAYEGLFANTDLRVNYNGVGSVTMQNVEGISFDIVNSNNVRYLTITGDIGAHGGNTPNTVSATDVRIAGELTIGDDVTFTATGVKVNTSATVNVDGTLNATSGNFVMTNNSTVNIEGQVIGVITAQTGTAASAGYSAPGTTTVEFSAANEDNYVAGAVLTVGQVTYVEKNVSMTDQILYISGNIDVVDVNTDDSKETATLTIINTDGISYVAEGDILDVDEYVAVKGGNTVVEGQVVYNADSKQKVEGFLGTGYVIEGAAGEDDVGYITTFEAAYAQIANAKDTTITILGDMTIEIDVNLAAKQTIDLNDKQVKIDTDATVEVQRSGTIDGKIYDVQGVLISYTGGGVTAPQNYAVYKKTTEYTQWSGLIPAINNAVAGDVIDVRNPATVEDDMTIPAGVTVNNESVLTFEEDLVIAETAVLNNENAIQMVGEKSSITVNGTLDSAEGSIAFMEKNTGADADTVPYVNSNKGVDDSRSMTSVGNTIIGANTDNNYLPWISAAYYTNDDGYTEYTTVAKAVAAAEVMEASVTNVYVIGTLNQSDDITLAAGTTLYNNGKATLGKITLTAGSNGAAGAKVVSNGQLTATVAGATGVVGSTSESTVELSKAALTAEMVSDTNNQNVTSDYLMISGNASGTPVTYAPAGAVTIATGTVNAGTIEFDEKGNTLTVAAGATFAIEKIGANAAELIVGNNEKKAAVTVEGTIVFANDGKLTMDAYSVMDVNGTMTVGDDMDVSIVGTLNVAGTLAVSTTEDKEAAVAVAANGVLAVEGTVTGAIDTVAAQNGTNGYIKAYAGADLTNAVIDMVAGAEEPTSSATAFYVNGDLYMTIYAQDGLTFAQVMGTYQVPVEKFDLAGFVTYIPGTNGAVLDIYTLADWYTDAELTDEADNQTLAENEALYFKAPAATAEVTISVGSGISIYIDDVRYDSGRTVSLAVGTHSVTATVNPGFTGTVNVTFAGQTVTNGQFEITAEMASAAYDGVLAISATGDITQDSTVVVDGGSSGSGEMGLTDYLLIILVILIVVMAIMVAMRLMRS